MGKADDALDRAWQRLQQAGDELSTRGLFSFALNAVENGSHAAEIVRAFEMAEALQDRDELSPTFGNFRWYPKNEKPVDRNAVEFCM